MENRELMKILRNIETIYTIVHIEKICILKKNMCKYVAISRKIRYT